MPQRMVPRGLAVGIFFLSQTAVGLLGNLSLICYFIIADVSDIRAKPIDLIVKHLTWANLIALCRGVPQTIAAFTETYYVDYVSCKLTLYFHRVARGVSLGSTSLLSVFQAIIISPRKSKWAQLKVRAPRIIGPSLGLCWSLQLLLYAFVPVYTTDVWSGQNNTGIKDLGYCVVMKLGRRSSTLVVILLVLKDVIFLGLMMWTSGYMVIILYKHKHRVQNIHTSLSPRSSPETRATKVILTLVSSFVCSYAISIAVTSYMALLEETTRWLPNMGVAMAACFPTFCPFVIIRHYTFFSRS